MKIYLLKTDSQLGKLPAEPQKKPEKNKVEASRDKKKVAQLPARIKLRRQPVGSNLCGHCCVAMVASLTTSTVLEVFGFAGPTHPAHLVQALGQLGFSPALRLVAFRHQAALPSCCLLKLA